jgi:hypothetical protein
MDTTTPHHAPPVYPARDAAEGLIPPAVRASAKCPSCGRLSAVVFPDLRQWKGHGRAPLVCLSCCPPLASAS